MKNNYIKSIVCICMLAGMENSLADVKIGMGTGATSVFSRGYGGVVSMPIKINSIILIEPYVGYSERSEDADKNEPYYTIYNRSSYQTGVGLYGINKLGANFEIYYGAALAVAKSEQKSENKRTNTFNGETSVYTNYSESDADEYMIKPTLGVSYLINDNFSFSLDAGIYYSWGEEKSKIASTDSSTTGTSSYDETHSEKDLEAINTFTRFLFRMMF